MSQTFIFSVREAPSDISPFKLLGEDSTSFPIELDYLIPAGEVLAPVDSFLTPPPLPGVGLWAAGEWAVVLNIAQATELTFTVELWRADSLGNDLEIVGSQASSESGVGPIAFSIMAVALDPNENPAFSSTDRLKLKILASNADSVNAQTLGVVASNSGVATPIAPSDQVTNQFNSYRRGRFLGFLFRPGEGAPYFDEHGINIDSNGQY